MNNNYQKEARTTDMHLLLSEKYMAYKDLADRCLIVINKEGKWDTTNHFLSDDIPGDKRAFYL